MADGAHDAERGTKVTQPPATHEFGARRAVTSAAQDRLWFVDTCVRASATYHVCRAYRVTGELRLDALRAAWAGLVARHESLRTTLISRAGRAAQLIAGEQAEVRSFTDLGSDPTLASDDEARLWCAELAATGLDLAVGPLARLVVARVAEREYLLVLLLHQAITDDESTSILIDELSTAYTAERIGRATRDVLPPPRAQYADFARWQRRRIAAGRLRALADWWATTLTRLPGPLTLPADRPRIATGEGGLLAFEWDERIARPLAGLAAAHRTTPFAVLLTAFQSLLHRYAAVDRIAVAVPVSVRSRPEFARIVGACREPVVVCTDVSGRPSFRELLGRVTATADDALRHRGLPFDQLVRLSRPDRDPRVPPLSDVAFVYRSEPEARLDLPGAAVTPLCLDTTVVNADLTLTVDSVLSQPSRPDVPSQPSHPDVDPVVRGSLAFRANMFERSSAQCVLDQLRTLLAGALADPDLPVDALPLDKPRRVRAWSPVARVMATIWAELVGAAPHRATDTFFAVGGHSLLVPQLLDRIRDRFGVTVSVREYVSHPTPAGLAGLVEDKLGHAVPGMTKA